MTSKVSSGNAPVILYRYAKSGHSHRVELMMALLGAPFEMVDVDMAKGAHKAPAFLAMNPFGQVPVIDDNGVRLSDSNAILVYLVRKYGGDHDWLPDDPVRAAEVQRWLSVAAGEIAYGPAAARLVKVFGANLDWDRAKAIAERLFGVMEQALANRDYLAGDAITIADIACYTYVAHAPEGGVFLDDFPAIRHWLARIESQRGFVAMTHSPIPAGA